MSNLSLFFKKNKKVKENRKFAPTKSMVDDAGNPLEWEIRHVTTREIEHIREECTIEVPVTGKPGLYRPKIDNAKFIDKMIVSAVVFPDLYNAELQDSYGVMSPEDLLKEMIDDAAEYNALAEFVKNFGDVDETLTDKVEEAKN